MPWSPGEGWLTAVGLLTGVLGGLAVSRALTGLLYEMSAIDPLTFVAVATLMALVALAAIWIPARRALRVNPIEALNRE